MKNIKIGFASALFFTLAACGGGGGGGGSSTPTPPVQNQEIAGVWTSTYTVTSGPNQGDTVKAILLASPTNQFYGAAVNENNGCAAVNFGQSSVTGSSFSSNATGAIVTFSDVPGINTGCVFPDGSTYGSESITGTVTSGQSVQTNSSTLTTSLGNIYQGSTPTFIYSAINSTAPSLSMVSGNYTISDGSALSISSSGAISEVSITTGCTISGQLTIPSNSYNIYDITVTANSCSASYSNLNGLTLAGLATYDTTVSPNRLGYIVSTNVGGGFVIFAGAWQR